MTDAPLLRPLVSDTGSYVLAGGWRRFDHLENLAAQGETRAASTLPEADLELYVGARAAICGLSMDRPRIMGIMNVTPDSFSDGGRLADLETAVDAAAQMVADGADILDIGGESTRPGAAEVAVQEEIERTAPVIEAIRTRFDTPLSIDTRKAAVAEAALAAGASLVNDVSAMRFDPRIAEVTAAAGVPICLMHSQGTPETMQNDPRYGDVVAEVTRHLSERIEAAIDAGIARRNIIVDPGIGFGKTLDHNLALLSHLTVLHGLGAPLLVGASRKRFIGTITGVEEAADRVNGSVAVALSAIAQGSQILRVHDVAATAQARAMWLAIHTNGGIYAH